jgi:hypothetical protein
MLTAVLSLLLLVLPAQEAEASPTADEPALAVSLYTGTLGVVTREERREYFTGRVGLLAPIHQNVRAIGRCDLTATQDGGALEDPSSFQVVECAAGPEVQLGPLGVAGVAGVTWNADGDATPRDSRLWTVVVLGSVDIGDGGYFRVGGGHFGPVGGWAAVAAASIPIGGNAFTTVDFALPFDTNALRERTWLLKVGASVRVKRFAFGGKSTAGP